MSKLAQWWRSLQPAPQAGRMSLGQALWHAAALLPGLHALAFVYMFYRLIPALRQPEGRHGRWEQARPVSRWVTAFLVAADLAGRLALMALALFAYCLVLFLCGKETLRTQQLSQFAVAGVLTCGILWWTFSLYAASERLGWRLAAWAGVAGRRPPADLRRLYLLRGACGALACILLTAFIALTLLALSGIAAAPLPGSTAQLWLLACLGGAYSLWLVLLALCRWLE